jgi:hypothetical protein
MVDEPGRARRTHAMSISARIVTSYALVALLTLTGAAFFLYSGMRDMFTYEDRERLSDCVLSVRQAVELDPLGLSAARRAVPGLAGERDVEQYYVRLMDKEGRVLMETPGIRPLDPGIQLFPAPPADLRGLSKIEQMEAPTGTPIFIASALISRGEGLEPLTCHVVLDIAHRGPHGPLPDPAHPDGARHDDRRHPRQRLGRPPQPASYQGNGGHGAPGHRRGTG